MPVVYSNGASTTASFGSGQWYATNNITWNTTTTTMIDYVEIFQADGARWRIPETALVESEDVPLELTPEQRAEQERLRQERRHRRETREQQQREANKAAKRLLLSLLSPENQRRLEARTTIRITGSDGGSYEIETTGGTTGNIIRRAGGRDTPRIPSTYRGRLCCHPRLSLPEGQLPYYDAIAAQALMIQNDEPAFLSLANIYH